MSVVHLWSPLQDGFDTMIYGISSHQSNKEQKYNLEREICTYVYIYYNTAMEIKNKSIMKGT